MAANNIISLTVLETGTAIKLNEGDIIQLVGVSSDADSAVTYVANNRTVKTVVMDETPTAIKALAPSLMDVTITETGTTLTISASRVEFAVASGSGCKITMDAEGASWNQFIVDESVTAIQTAVNAASAGEFVETTGNQTVAGVKTFTGVLTSSNATASTTTTTGGATFAGGVGIAGALFVSTTTPASISNTGVLSVTNATASSSTTTGAVKVTGGVGIAKELFVSTTTPFSVSAAGVVTVTNATASTTKDTGALIITDGGVGVEGAIFAGATINAGTALTVGTDVTLAKEVNHLITVATTTTAATVGGDLTIIGGAGATSGAGGLAVLAGGAGGTTGAGGIVAIQSGAGGATSGASGQTGISSGNATVGNTGVVTINSGNTASGAAGDVILTTGTHTSTTVCPVVSLGKAVVKRPTNTSVATGATASIIGIISGSLDVTGATGNVTLPTGTEISTAIGSVTPGTSFEFIVNTIGMTAGNVATLVVAAGIVTAKQVSSGDSATDQLLTVTNTSNVNIGVFKMVNIAANSWSLHRLA